MTSFVTREKPVSTTENEVQPIKKIDKPAIKDARFSLIGNLPSNYMIYPFKELQIRSFDISELELIAKSVIEKDDSFIFQAVDNCIDQSVYDLTEGDFEFILYWLRLHSYTRSPLMITWLCSKCSKKNLTRIMKTNIIINSIDENFEMPDNLTMPIMRDYAKKSEMIKEVPTNKAIISAASWVVGDSMEEKLANMRKAGNIELYEEARHLASTLGAHGVSEEVMCKCDNPECGASSRVTFSVNLRTFFP